MTTYKPMDENVLAIFKDVALYNPDENHRCFYVDPIHNVAYGGFRRLWQLGDLFVRYRSEDIDFNPIAGLYLLEGNEFIKGKELPGPKQEDGIYEELDLDWVNNKFNQIYEMLEEGFTLRLNPAEVLTFIEDATYSEGTYMDRVINIQPFYQTNGYNHFVGQLHRDEDVEGGWLTVLKTPDGEIGVRVQQTNQDRVFNFDRAKVGDWVVFAPIGEVDGYLICRALYNYEPGIRMAVQHFNSGFRSRTTAPLTVLFNEQDSGIGIQHIKTFKFLKDQALPPLNKATMFTVQLDTFVRTMNTLSRFKTIELKYVNSHTPFLAYGVDENQEFQVEVIGSCLAPHTLGKVIT